MRKKIPYGAYKRRGKAFIAGISKYKIPNHIRTRPFTGLRPNEYNTAKIEGQFIVAVNSKRKHKRVEYKRIPITPMLAPYVQGITSFEIVNRDVIREKFKAILPNHIVYDMRTTFYSRCKECGIADAARDEFVGHSLGALGNAYTDLSDEYLLQEGAKFKY